MASARADPMFATMSSSPWTTFPVTSASASSSSVYVLFWCELQGWHRRTGTCRCTWSETKFIANRAYMGPTARAPSTHVSYESKRRTRSYLGQSLSVKDVRLRTKIGEGSATASERISTSTCLPRQERRVMRPTYTVPDADAAKECNCRLVGEYRSNGCLGRGPPRAAHFPYVQSMFSRSQRINYCNKAFCEIVDGSLEPM